MLTVPQCNPVLVDAVDVSPAHRARYFWGNLPGMCRSVVSLPLLTEVLREAVSAGLSSNRMSDFQGFFKEADKCDCSACFRPIVASQKDKLSLQECLEIGRKARVRQPTCLMTGNTHRRQGYHHHHCVVCAPGDQSEDHHHQPKLSEAGKGRVAAAGPGQRQRGHPLDHGAGKVGPA